MNALHRLISRLAFWIAWLTAQRSPKRRPARWAFRLWLSTCPALGGGGTPPAAIAAINTLLSLGDSGSPPSFSVIANISDITGPQLAATVVDVTSHSTTVPWRQRIPTLLDVGDLTCKLWFVPGSTGHQQLLDIFAGRNLEQYTITWPQVGAPTWWFEAYITKFSITAAVAGALEATVTFSGTTEPSFNYIP